MNRDKKAYSDRLIEMEQITPVLKEKYDMEIQALVEKPIKGVQKLAWIAMTIGGFGFMLLFGTVAIWVPAEFPLLGRLGFIAGAVFGLGWAVLGIEILRRGAINLRKHAPTAAGMGWGLVIIMSTISLLTMGNEPQESLVGLRMCIGSLLFLVPASLFMTRSLVERSELKIQEKLLEIECRLAQLSETADNEKKN